MPGLRIKNPNYLKELKRKFLEKFKVNENGCWIWQRGCHKQGYGNCKYKRKTLLAHRLSWMLFKGELKDTDVVCHKCDITACVNPDHLFKGTTKDNVHDCMRKKRDRHLTKEQHPRSKINRKDSKEIKKLLALGFSQTKIGKLFDVWQTTISEIKRNVHWTTKT